MDLPLKGAKEFLPDNSWLQNKRLDKINEMRNSMLKEERVETSGNLGRGIWIPEDDVVQLTHGKGNFWRYVGYTENGMDYLHPEEALFMVDLGVLEIEYKGFPMSLQTAYRCLLQTVSIIEYQVYAYLSRLGFIVIRHKKLSKLEITQYEKEINLDQHLRHQLRKSSKRKRVLSADTSQDTKTKKLSKLPPDSDDFEVGDRSCETEGFPSSGIAITELDNSHCQMPITCDIISPKAAAELSKNWAKRLPQSDWSNINLPDLRNSKDLKFQCSGKVLNHEPTKTILCESFNFPFSQDNNIPKSQDFSFSAKVCRPSAKNWTEYKLSLVGIESDEMYMKENLKNSPVGVLWDNDVSPLVKPWEATSTSTLLEKLQVVKPADIPVSECHSTKISYDVYPADEKGTFRKSDPGLPQCHIIVHHHANNPPDIATLNCCLKDIEDGVSLIFAVVDYGNISFYSYSDFCLPVDIIT